MTAAFEARRGGVASVDGRSTSTASPTASDSDRAVRIDTRAWFQESRKVIEIDHHGTIYRLRCTAQGKLILTK